MPAVKLTEAVKKVAVPVLGAVWEEEEEGRKRVNTASPRASGKEQRNTCLYTLNF